jgi:hypothetical protein
MIGNELIGKRIKLITMFNDPHPIESGSMGTITNVNYPVKQISVKWDNGRTLGVDTDVDKYEILEDTDLPPHNFLVFSGNI